MTSILCRTLIIYLFLMIVMRLMGKRQLGELQVSELISTLLLSEVAAIPIADANIPILYGLIPVAFIFSLEIILPSLFFRFPNLRKLIEGTPCFLILNGKIQQRELRRNRITPEEFLAVLRTNGVSDPTDISYAILEASGAISIFLTAQSQPPVCEDLPDDFNPPVRGIAHVLITDGRYNRSMLKQLNISKAKIEQLLTSKKIALKAVFLLTMDDLGQYTIIRKEEKT